MITVVITNLKAKWDSEDPKFSPFTQPKNLPKYESGSNIALLSLCLYVKFFCLHLLGMLMFCLRLNLKESAPLLTKI